MKPIIHALIIDLDDTLYNEKEYVKSGFMQISNFLAKLNYGLSKEFYDFLILNYEEGERGTNIDNLMKNFEIHDLDKNILYDIYRFHYPKLNQFDHVEEFFKNHPKLPICIMTEGHPVTQFNKLKSLNYSANIIEIIATRTWGPKFGKPSAKGYEFAILTLEKYFNKILDYSNIVYIGDNLKKDFQWPIKNNMHSVYIKNKNSVIKNPMKVPSIVKKISTFHDLETFFNFS